MWMDGKGLPRKSGEWDKSAAVDGNDESYRHGNGARASVDGNIEVQQLTGTTAKSVLTSTE